MTWAEIGDVLLKVVAYLGGGAVIVSIVVGIAGFVAKIIADRTVEGRKAELSKQVEEKKSELAKEVEQLRVCPKTSGGITKFSEHEAD